MVWRGNGTIFIWRKNYLNEINIFNEFYLKVKEETKIIPNLNEIKHGTSFENENYSGYNLSYLVIRYLSETLNENEFYKLLLNINKLKEIGLTAINDMFNYYDEKITKHII